MSVERATRLRVACVSDATDVAAVLAETVATIVPGADVDVADAASVRSVPESDVAVVEAFAGDEASLEMARSLRARGFAGALVLLLASADDGVREGAARIGARRVPRERIAEALPEALASALAGDERRRDARAELRRTQRLIAAGEIALGLQHALNNPLAALLAEAQLLELEPLPADQAEAAERIVEYTRRVIDVVRRLDEVGRG
jgi:signal transduction histidine kinase